MAVVFLLAFHQGLVFGQGTKITMEHDPVIDTDRDKPGEREQWFMRGRTLPGQATAALRYQAHLRKMQMRAARKAALQIQGLAGVSTISGSWTPLGPSPLASDATGFGGQDYGAVSGRATSVAVDPADPTGNTVYVGVPMEESGNPATQDRLARPMLSGLPSLNTKPRWRSARWSLCNLQSGRGAFGRQLSEPSNSLLHRSTCEKHLFI